ncbi:hypothetical protein [Streptomyces poonensis]|uniref:Uncharacterized protein n=1 Tax=Streptomyces poonensis TaxID=68255 RepID=A0A918PLX4_9ACTN|nr:hypothetical protein GCM10010365_39030 [Streptomyces poonensis]GLJ91506.1 hypothetical protein GCM10017589_41130 [Streptomyces poonensis]
MRQFLMTDPGGNCIRDGQPVSDHHDHRPAPEGTFARALHQAALFADSKDDPKAAARVPDRVLRLEDERPKAVQLFRLFALRADVADRLGDDEGKASALAEAALPPSTG